MTTSEALSVPPVYDILCDPQTLARLINGLAGIDGATDRTVILSARSSLVCPAHGRVLKPDTCRSCAFLAGP
jgi:hypothetical protein